MMAFVITLTLMYMNWYYQTRIQNTDISDRAFCDPKAIDYFRNKLHLRKKATTVVLSKTDIFFVICFPDIQSEYDDFLVNSIYSKQFLTLIRKTPSAHNFIRKIFEEKVLFC